MALITSSFTAYAEDDDDDDHRPPLTVDIAKAVWNINNRLVLVGTVNRIVPAPVNVVAYGVQIGSVTVAEDNTWRFASRNTPPPCEVSVNYAYATDSAVIRINPDTGVTCSTEPPNLPPIPHANGPYEGNVNDPIQFSSAGSTDPDGTIVAYRWVFGDGKASNDANPVHTYTTAGVYDLKLRVTDDDGVARTDKTQVTINGAPVNIDPTANANGPYSGVAGQSISFSSAGSNDPDGTIVSYSWNFGDGATSNQTSPSHTYATAGTYNVSLTVTDDDGGVGTDSTTSTIIPANIFPTAIANGPYSGTAGQSVSFSSAGSNDPDGTIVSYSWTFGDGATSNQANPSHTYATAGTYNVSLIVTDNDGADGVDSTTANIAAAPANVITVSSVRWREGTLRIVGTAPFEERTVRVSLPDGTLIGSRRAEDDGRFQFEISVSPEPCQVIITQFGATPLTVIVSTDPSCGIAPPNENPVAEANGPYSGQVGANIQFSSAGSTDPDGTIVSYSWAFGDGATSNQTNPTHAYATAGTYTVTLTVTDNDGASDGDSAISTISAAPVNIPPSANANGPYAGQIGDNIQFSSAGSTDPDGTIVSYAWTFGDGAVSNQANPTHAYTSVGTFNVTLTVTDNDGASDGDSTTSTISAAPVNIPPTAVANGPYAGIVGANIQFSSNGSNDPDGTIASYSWSFGDGVTSTEANPLHAYTGVGDYVVTLTVTDNEDASDIDVTSAAITSLPPPDCTSDIPEHCTITSYSGPDVCVSCHRQEAMDAHGGVHYQQGGAFPNVTNIPTSFAAAGERPAHAAGDLVATGINTFCGTHENSPRFTCAGCHVGNGRFPLAQAELEKLTPGSAEETKHLANVDCLMCHQEQYKRFPDWTASGYGFTDLTLLNVTLDNAGKLVHSDGSQVVRTGFAGIPNVDPVTQDFQFMPLGADNAVPGIPLAPMTLTTVEAAQNVHRTTKVACLNCHAGAGGGDGFKRGDLSKQTANASVSLDMHMSAQGANLTCADCHATTGDNGETHRMRGRGVDLRPNDTSERFVCSACHSERPHGDYNARTGSSLDKHAMKVACQTCHIPRYAKADVGTEVARDWQAPHTSEAACNGRGGWLPNEIIQATGSASLTPIYKWFSGKSEVYYLGESLNGVPTVPLASSIASAFVGNFNSGDPTYVLGLPLGEVTDDMNTKIYPMREHWGKLVRNDNDNTLVGHSTFEFFRTGSICRAAAVGLGIDENNQPTSSVCTGLPGQLETPPNTTMVPVMTYESINHGVEVSGNALNCGSCHDQLSGGPVVMNLESLGLGIKAPTSTICRQCHGSESSGFSSVHSRHVQNFGYDCSFCHNFSRAAERGLRTTR